MREMLILLSALALAACAGTGQGPQTDTDTQTEVQPQQASGAGDVPDEFAIEDIPDYLSYLEQLRMEMETGELGAFRQSDMKLFAESTQELNQLLSGVTDIDELSEDEKVRVYNAQEAVNAVLTHNAENRPICRRQHTVGTHMRTTVCSTASQQKEMRERAHNAINHIRKGATFIDPTIR